MQASVSKDVQFDAGHRVPSHASKCRNPHGHRYRVVAYCVGDVVEDGGSADDGMVVDFGIPAGMVWVMPEGRTAEAVNATAQLLAEAVIACGFNLSHRLHVLLWGDERGR